jgi:hypothetical protein
MEKVAPGPGGRGSGAPEEDEGTVAGAADVALHPGDKVARAGPVAVGGKPLGLAAFSGRPLDAGRASGLIAKVGRIRASAAALAR